MKKFDVLATTGTYMKDGEKKYKSQNVGAVIQTKHGLRLKLDASFNPAGCPRDDDGGVWLALFEPREKKQENPAQMAERVMNEPPMPEEQIPF